VHGGEWGLSISLLILSSLQSQPRVKGMITRSLFNWEYRAAAKCPGSRETGRVPDWNGQTGLGLASRVILTQQFLFQNQPGTLLEHFT